MSVIYLQHPVHGAKVATCEMEADYDALSGWTRFDPTVPAAPVEEAPRRSRRRPVEDAD